MEGFGDGGCWGGHFWGGGREKKISEFFLAEVGVVGEAGIIGRVGGVGRSAGGLPEQANGIFGVSGANF